MVSPQERLDAIRSRRSEYENHLIDEVRAGKIGRREFVRRVATAGMALPIAGFVAAACADHDPGSLSPDPTAPPDTAPEPARTSVPQTSAPSTIAVSERSGSAILRIGQTHPTVGLDPVTIGDQAALALLAHTGEYLVRLDDQMVPRPGLAKSWTHNTAGDVWTFRLREGVTFHDGRALDADDVAATLNRLADPDLGSNALSTVAGVLAAGSAKAVDASTVEFSLLAPNGNFPYLVSSDNYNSVILPKDYAGDWEQTFIGTGPWRLDRYTPDEGVTFVPNSAYWDRGRIPKLARLDVRFLADETAMLAALESGEVDYAAGIHGGRRDIVDNPDVVVAAQRTAAHRQIHMRVDRPPLDDKRIRQAIALLVDRQAIVETLFGEYAEVGNDTPFAPVHVSTSSEVAQRVHDPAEAMKLLHAAGVTDGLNVKLETWEYYEMPELAEMLRTHLSAGNIRLELSVTDPSTYYGDAVYGNSPWLDSTMGITEYGHRSLPNVVLRQSLSRVGQWNSAHFRNDTYERLVADYVSALDLDAQRRAARAIEELLLDESPIMISYFHDFLAAARPGVSGVVTTPFGQLDTTRATVN